MRRAPTRGTTASGCSRSQLWCASTRSRRAKTLTGSTNARSDTCASSRGARPMIDIKQALYVAETARRMGHESLTKEQMCEALVALAEEHERLTDELAEAEVDWMEEAV